MINDLPTIFEVVTGNAKQSKDQSANHNSSKSKSSGGKVEASVYSFFFLSLSSYLCWILSLFTLLFSHAASSFGISH